MFPLNFFDKFFRNHLYKSINYVNTLKYICKFILISQYLYNKKCCLLQQKKKGSVKKNSIDRLIENSNFCFSKYFLQM